MGGGNEESEYSFMKILIKGCGREKKIGIYCRRVFRMEKYFKLNYIFCTICIDILSSLPSLF
jgi:hypothetical protein